MLIVDLKNLKRSYNLFLKISNKLSYSENLLVLHSSFRLIHQDCNDLKSDKFNVIPVLDLKDLKQMYQAMIQSAQELGNCLGFHYYLCNIYKTALYIIQHIEDQKRI